MEFLWNFYGLTVGLGGLVEGLQPINDGYLDFPGMRRSCLIALVCS